MNVLTVDHQAQVLQESNRPLLTQVLRTVGQDRCRALLAYTLHCEATGGMLRRDGTHRRRTPGGVFFRLVKGLRMWLLLGGVLLWVVLAWLIVEEILWPTGSTPEDLLHQRQRHTRVMRYGSGVVAGVVLLGMTRWVYWTLCTALDTVKNEGRITQQMDAQTLRDLCTGLEVEYDVDHGGEA